MTITINEDICKKNGLETAELLAILLIKTEVDIPKLFESMEDKKMITKSIFNNYLISQRYDDIACSILLDSDKDSQSPERIENLALKLMAVFPKEKKAGTCHYFRGNKKDISLRLKKFFKLYGSKYTDDEIVEAAKQYVASFNGNYAYMRILKYFIWKDERKLDSEGNSYIEEVSDLATCIENKGQDTHNDNWTTVLR